MNFPLFWKRTPPAPPPLQLRLPPRFIRDSLESGCDVGAYRDGHLIATPAQLAELKSRAAFYLDGTDAAPPGLTQAAQALLSALAKREAAPS